MARVESHFTLPFRSSTVSSVGELRMTKVGVKISVLNSAEALSGSGRVHRRAPVDASSATISEMLPLPTEKTTSDESAEGTEFPAPPTDSELPRGVLHKGVRRRVGPVELTHETRPISVNHALTRRKRTQPGRVAVSVKEKLPAGRD